MIKNKEQAIREWFGLNGNELMCSDVNFLLAVGSEWTFKMVLKEAFDNEIRIEEEVWEKLLELDFCQDLINTEYGKRHV